ncbi:hypothetical protein KIF59_03755 [Enterobacter cloacae subsp. cloacae]|nr:hypothetical protein [Enterobacter cloacae subsp. cloacae]
MLTGEADCLRRKHLDYAADCHCPNPPQRPIPCGGILIPIAGLRDERSNSDKGSPEDCLKHPGSLTCR